MRRSFLTGFSVFSFLGVAAGLYFRSHYFILMVPAACLLIGVAVDSWEESLRGRPALRLLLPQVAVAAALFQGFWNERQLLFTLSPTEACRSVYGLNPFPESLEVGRYLREHSDRDTKVAVIGSEPQIYFYSGRHSATGYLYTYPLMEIHPFARMMQEEMIREIETADPEYVVFVSIRASWLAWERSERLLTEWFRDYSARKLELVGVIDSFRSLGPVSLWGEEARAFRIGDDQCLLIYRRKGETEPHS
jgi:hypothetical protein